MKTVYLAGRYSRREELCGYRQELQAKGYRVQARWLDGNHQLSDAGIPMADNGERLAEASQRAAELRLKFAQEDKEDVFGADIVINFTEPPRAKPSRGGRHVEFGIALASGAMVIVVGYRENIFHWLDRVRFFPCWEEALRTL